MSWLHAAHALEMTDACINCRLRCAGFFCSLQPATLQKLSDICFTTIYPEGSILFLQGQPPRGAYVLCRGRAKLSMVSTAGKSLIIRIAQPGNALGVSACMAGRPYPVTVETLTSCQVNFIRREDFLPFMRENLDATFQVARWLSMEYQSACRELGWLALATSAAEKLARLLLRWHCSIAADSGSPFVKLSLTHEDMAQMIGASRETVTRMLARFRARGYVEVHGASVVIHNRAALAELAGNSSVNTTDFSVLPLTHRALAAGPRATAARCAVSRLRPKPSKTAPTGRGMALALVANHH